MLELCFAISMHFGVGEGWNERHPCARYVAEDFTVGAYLNSENTVSAFVSHTFEHERWMAEVGAVTGYSGASVVPMLRLGYEITDNVLLFTSPAYADGRVGAVVGLEYKMGM
jgi:hypothetical protein